MKFVFWKKRQGAQRLFMRERLARNLVPAQRLHNPIGYHLRGCISVDRLRSKHKRPHGVVRSQAYRYVEYHLQFVIGRVNHHAHMRT